MRSTTTGKLRVNRTRMTMLAAVFTIGLSPLSATSHSNATKLPSLSGPTAEVLRYGAGSVGPTILVAKAKRVNQSSIMWDRLSRRARLRTRAGAGALPSVDCVGHRANRVVQRGNNSEAVILRGAPVKNFRPADLWVGGRPSQFRPRATPPGSEVVPIQQTAL
jgi:hypothetical protein